MFWVLQQCETVKISALHKRSAVMESTVIKLLHENLQSERTVTNLPISRSQNSQYIACMLHIDALISKYY